MIVITTPTGLIGHQVLGNLLGSGEALRVIDRDPSRIPAGVREHVEVIKSSHGNPDVVDDAFAGGDAVFWLAPPDPRAESVEAAYVGFTRPAAEAFKRHAVKRVVGISALGRGTPWAAHAGYVSGSLAMDDLIGSTGVGYRALTNPSFMDNILRQTDAIKNQSMFFSPISGDRHLSAVAKPVRFQQLPFQAYTARFVELGMSEAMAQGMTVMAAAKNEGLDNAVKRTAENSTPTSFRQWCEEVLKPAVVA